jgi:hypothetical protein
MGKSPRFLPNAAPFTANQGRQGNLPSPFPETSPTPDKLQIMLDKNNLISQINLKTLILYTSLTDKKRILRRGDDDGPRSKKSVLLCHNRNFHQLLQG